MPPGLALDLVTCWRVDTLPRLATAQHWNTALQTRNTFFGTLASMPKGGRESAKYRGFLDQAWVEAALVALAAAQHGVISLSQLLELGLSARAVQSRAATGRLHRIHHGVYSLVPRELLKREGLYMAAVLACGDGAVLSHRSAARLHELRNYGYTRIEVTVPKRSARTHAGVAVHRSTTLTDADLTVVENIPVTTVARTLFDLGEVVTQRQLERALDQAEIAETLDLHAINDQLARNPTRKGAKKVRRVLAEHYIGQTPTWSENEELLLSITRPLGIPDPDTNQFIVLDDGGPAIRVDFVWRKQRIIVEADSRKWHLSRQRFESDRERDQRLTAAGWTVIRTTWRQMKYRPHQLRPILIKLLAPASPDGPATRAVAGAPAPARPRTRRAGGSTS
jgi:predicted transcriptional regulator of viral defense system